MVAPEMQEMATTVHIRLESGATNKHASADGAELSVPSHCGRKALRSVVRSLLSLEDDATSPDFHFAAHVGEARIALRTTLGKLITRHALSPEATLTLIYYEPVPAPARRPSPPPPPQPTWLCAIDARDDGILVTGAMCGTAAVRGVDGATLFSCDSHSAPLKDVAWADSSTFLTAAQDEALRVWSYDADAQNAVATAVFRTEDHGASTSLESVACGGDIAAVGAFDGSLWLLPRCGKPSDTSAAPVGESGKRARVDEAPVDAHRLAGATGLCVPALGFAGSKLMSGGWDSCVRVWDAEAMAQALVLPAGGRPVTGLCGSESGVVATCGGDGAVRLLDSRGEKGVVGACAKKGMHTAIANGIEWVDEGAVAVSAGADGCLRVWDLRAMDVPVHVLRHAEETAGVNVLDVAVAKSEKGRCIASAGSDGLVATFTI